MGEDDRRFVNNPFARALHPERARGLRGWLALALVSLVAACLFAAALLMPALFMHGLIKHGVAAHRWGMVAAGGLMVIVYALVLIGMLRKRRAR